MQNVNPETLRKETTLRTQINTRIILDRLEETRPDGVYLIRMNKARGQCHVGLLGTVTTFDFSKRNGLKFCERYVSTEGPQLHGFSTKFAHCCRLCSVRSL
jgi:hypothetical protein